ncbi:TRAP transporter substrate-binding protein [Ottowia sp.]|mgnify:CR=1 FL=1|jgi:tripartite ATP-independent transporter DctP family solute receptor|uniref:TRAP transporter substrate-binding protein n=1 Tax=Ottowia sp. TaxID=1898956 RepID=UPI0025F3C61D|nr:TRAP transporter substrate-binding protein [Ottowia sp.]MBK6613048.1 TRAP transporter substrate-binding protein [Ottowia sp.]MBK6747840.1 TRAP transporter substrate-binding protein [Ottowia sp.]
MPSNTSFSRRALVASAAVLAAPFIMPRPARASTELALGYPLPLNSQFGAAATAFADELARLTQGRFTVKQFPASSLGGEREMIEGVQLGTQPLALVSTGALPNFVPQVAVLDLPFLFRNYAHAHAVLDGAIGQELLGRFPARGLVALAWGEGGFRHITNNKRPVAAPGDLRGLKIRTQENTMHIAAFKGMGAIPTPINWPETFVALQQGTVDGQDNPISVIEAAKLYEVQKHLSLTEHLYSPALFLASPAVLAKLPQADQDALRAAARVGAAAMRRRVARDERTGVANLRQRGMAVVESIDKAPFIAALQPSYQDFNQRFGAATIDRIRQAG